jgi:hypothetical protein
VGHADIPRPRQGDRAHDAEEMRELLVEAWRMVAPKRLRAAYDADQGLGG